jgi:uncharacterized protein YcfL
LILALLVGCTTTPHEYIKPEVFTISGMNSYQEISSDRPVIITVTGMGSTVKVLEGTEVQKVTITAMNAVIYMPQGSSPKIINAGMNSEVRYY